MKTHVKILAAAALSVAASTPSSYGADAATTAPVGYRTETLANGFNLMATNLLTKVESSGVLETAVGMTVTDAQANFSSLGTSDLLLKITDGTAAGTIIQCNQTNATTLTCLTAPPAAAAGAKYELRLSHTIASLFGAGSGATAPIPFAGGDLDTADNIYVPDGNGGFIIVYYNDGSNPFASTGWVDVVGDPAGNVELPYNLAFYIRNIGAGKDLVLTGHVADTVSTNALAAGYNYVSRILPVGYTLAQSGIETQIRQGDGDPSRTDLVYIPQGPGNFRICYYNDGSDPFNPTLGWFDLGGGDASGQVIPSGFLLLRTVATPANLNITIPSQFDV